MKLVKHISPGIQNYHLMRRWSKWENAPPLRVTLPGTLVKYQEARPDRPVSVGDFVLIQSEERNRRKWLLEIVADLYPGRDGVVRSVKLRAGRSYLGRPGQRLCPLELSCDRSPTVPTGP